MKSGEDEVVLDRLDKLHCWRKPKPTASLIGAYRGGLLLTNRRLLFLSLGTSGVARAALMSALLGPVGLVLGQTPTAKLDLSALENEGSLAFELNRLTEVQVRRRWDLSSYLYVDAGPDAVYTFMTKLGWNPGALKRFLFHLNGAR